jgi:hypothetical protein
MLDFFDEAGGVHWLGRARSLTVAAPITSPRTDTDSNIYPAEGPRLTSG